MNLKPAAIVATLALGAFCLAGPVKVTIDGEPMTFTGQGAEEVKGHVMVPMRAIFEKLGATVEYDVSSQTAKATKDDTTIEIQMRRHFARVNDNDTPLEVPAQIMHDTTMVPLRFVSQALGARVTWDEAHQTVIIITKGDSSS